MEKQKRILFIKYLNNVEVEGKHFDLRYLSEHNIPIVEIYSNADLEDKTNSQVLIGHLRVIFEEQKGIILCPQHLDNEVTYLLNKSAEKEGHSFKLVNTNNFNPRLAKEFIKKNIISIKSIHLEPRKKKKISNPSQINQMKDINQKDRERLFAGLNKFLFFSFAKDGIIDKREQGGEYIEAIENDPDHKLEYWIDHIFSSSTLDTLRSIKLSGLSSVCNDEIENILALNSKSAGIFVSRKGSTTRFLYTKFDSFTRSEQWLLKIRYLDEPEVRYSDYKNSKIETRMGDTHFHFFEKCKLVELFFIGPDFKCSSSEPLQIDQTAALSIDNGISELKTDVLNLFQFPFGHNFKQLNLLIIGLRKGTVIIRISPKNFNFQIFAFNQNYLPEFHKIFFLYAEHAAGIFAEG